MPDANTTTRGLSAAQIRFIEWCAQVPSQREPRLLKTLAGRLGVDKSRFSHWRRRPEVAQAIAQRLTELMPAADPEVWGATVRAACRGDVAAMRLYWEMRGYLRREGGPGTIVPVQINVTLSP